MRWFGSGGHRKLLFRSYLFLGAGLVIVAAALDLGFAYLQSRLAPGEDAWLDYSFRLVEAQLHAVAPHERDVVAARLARHLGVGVQILGPEDVHTAGSGLGERASRLTDRSGNVSYLRNAPLLDGSIRLGPVASPRDSLLLRMLPTLFYVSIFLLVALWLRPLLRDLDLITRSARQFAADYREPLVTAGATTQLTALAKNLDEMSARLSSLIQGQKELTAALSHEMRTPLARIRFALAVLEHDGNDELKTQLRDINADVEEIDELVASILEYARLDHPDLSTSWELVPLDPWLRQTLASCNRRSEGLEIATEEGLEAAWMDPRLMALAVSNLVVNACRYARGRVRVTAACGKSDYRLTVEDDGPGIPAPARESIFKAFTRLDGSRSRETGGYGLGLAIVARIAALHDGVVIVDDSPNLRGARFTLRWARR
jgi:signal transduction histidine kinase